MTAEPVLSFCWFAAIGTFPGVGITAAQFDRMKQRTGASRRHVATPVAVSSTATAVRRHSVILGVDPSLRGTGYGIIQWMEAGPQYVTAGTIRCASAWERSRCLVRISQLLRHLIRTHSPTVCAIEGLFYAQNLQTAIVMGEARGAALAAIAESGVEIHEIAPRKVKQAIVGYGAAQKPAVGRMVQRMLNLRTVPEPDAGDALALALTYAQEQRSYAFKPAKRL